MKREPICEGQMLPTEKSKKTMECGGEETAVKNWMTEECFSIFDSLDEPTYISDPETYEILYANSTLTVLLGKDIIGRKCYEALQGLDQPCRFCSNSLIFGEGSRKVYIWEHFNPLLQRWYHCIDKPIKWSDGRPVRCEMAIDITDRRKAEEELKKRLAYEKMLADISARALMIKDLDGFLNESFRTMGRVLDVSRIYIFKHDHDLETMDNTFEWTADDVSPQKENLQGIPASSIPWWMEMMKNNQIINCRDIEEIPGEREKEILRFQAIQSLLVVPLFIKNFYYGFMGFDECRFHRNWQTENVDILKTISQIIIKAIETKSAEESLRQSEERYRGMVEDTPGMICRFLPDGRLTYVNRSYRRYFSKTKDEMIGENFFQFIPEEDRQTLKEHILSLTPQKPMATYEYRVIPPDGSICVLEWTNRALFSEQGHLVEYHSIGRDVSESRRAQDEKIKLEKQLQQAQKMEAIGTLAGGIAHDFNNILAAIIGYTEIASFSLEKGSNTESNLQKALEASKRAKDLVRRILSFSRQSDPKREPVNMAPLVKETLKLLRASLPTTIEIHSHIENESGIIEADTTQIHQVLMNLCTNAAHAMENKGGVLDVRLTKVKRDAVSATENPEPEKRNYLKLTVRDSGSGMQANIIERIFDPYFTTKEKGKGTGLGLAVVRGIVKSHGGCITVKSEPEKGSTFDVYFPCIEPEAESTIKMTDETLFNGHERILFVDDDSNLAEIAKEMLEYLGYQVIIKTNSLEALDLFRKQANQFDLIITDMTMPNMTGDKLAKEILKIRPDIPIIMCTGYSENITKEKAMTMGIRKFAMKPFVMRDLAKIIREVLA